MFPSMLRSFSCYRLFNSPRYLSKAGRIACLVNTVKIINEMAKKLSPEENYWTPFQQDVLKMVQRHPVTYIRDIMMTPTQYKAAVTTAWERISRDIHMPRKFLFTNLFCLHFHYVFCIVCVVRLSPVLLLYYDCEIILITARAPEPSVLPNHPANFKCKQM